ncbi:MAG: ABC transporter permease [Gemmatimonadota bacterium]
MSSLQQDVRFALRSFASRPGFVMTVIAALALGIGANAAVFSILDAVLLDPLPVNDPGQVVAVYEAQNEATPHGGMSFANYRKLAERSRTLTGLAAFSVSDIAVDVADHPEQLSAGLVTGNYFPVLGLRAVRGRLFTTADDGAPGASPHVVLSYAYWTSAFAADPKVVGRVIRIAGNPFSVIGVAPRGFSGTELQSAPALWIPITMHRSLSLGLLSSPQALETPFLSIFSVVGRLRDGATAAQAAAELNALRGAIEQANPPSTGSGDRAPLAKPVSVLPATEGAALRDRENLLRYVRMLLGTVLLTLLLACLNVANLMLVRGRERLAELGVRLALGATRRRIMRQLFVETALLAVTGAAAGLLVGAVTMRLFSSFSLPGGIRLSQAGFELDGRVLAFTAGLAIITAIGVGLAPAMTAARTDPAVALRTGSGRGTKRRSHGLLVSGQIAISLVLLVGASLFLRSVRAGLRTDVGFDASPLTAISMEPRKVGYNKIRALQLYRDAATRARQIPGVTSVSVATHVPLARAPMLPFSVAGGKQGENAPPPRVTAGFASVTPGHFATLGVRMQQGRDFAGTDNSTAGRVVILNESAARAFFGDASPLGQRLGLFGDIEYTVIGVVHDTKYQSVRDDGVPFVFAPLEQEPDVGGVSILVRSGTPDAVLPALRTALHETDASVPLRDARLVARQMDAALMPQRFGAMLLSVFGLVALAITAIGIYGTVAYTVTQRTREIGIRSALGAPRTHIMRLVLRSTGVAVLNGALLGGLLALAATRTAAHFLYGVEPTDMVAFVASATVLLCTTLLVALQPARRAARIDPAVAMRAE